MSTINFFLSQKNIELTCGYINQNEKPITSSSIYSIPFHLTIYPISQELFTIKLIQGKEIITEGVFENQLNDEQNYTYDIIPNDHLTLKLKAQCKNNPIENLIISYDLFNDKWNSVIFKFQNNDNKTTHLFTKEYETTLCPWNKRKSLYQKILKRVCYIILAHENDTIQIPVDNILNYLEYKGFKIDNRKFLFLLNELNFLIHKHNPTALKETLFHKYQQNVDREEMFIIDYLGFEQAFIKQVLRLHFNEEAPAQKDLPNLALITSLKTKVVNSYHSINGFSTSGQANNNIQYNINIEEKNVRKSYTIFIEKVVDGIAETICDGIFNFKASIPFAREAVENLGNPKFNNKNEFKSLQQKYDHLKFYNYYQIESSNSKQLINQIYLNNVHHKCSDIIEIIAVEKNGLNAHHLFPKLTYYNEFANNWYMDIYIKKILNKFIARKEINQDEFIILPISFYLKEEDFKSTIIFMHEHKIKFYIDQLNHLARLHGIINSNCELICYNMNNDFSNLYSTPHTTLQKLKDCLEMLS